MTVSRLDDSTTKSVSRPDGSDDEELYTAHALARVRHSMFRRGPGGIQISRYLLQERLGAGGEGGCLRRRGPRAGTPRAIKLLSGDKTPDEDHLRLLREARTLARSTTPTS